MKMNLDNLDEVVGVFVSSKQKGIEYAESLPTHTRAMATEYVYTMMNEFINNDSVEVVFCGTPKETIDYIDMLIEITVNTLKAKKDIEIIDTGMSMDSDKCIVRDTTIEFTNGNKKYKKTIFVLDKHSTYPSEIFNKKARYFGVGVYPTKENSAFTITQMDKW